MNFSNTTQGSKEAIVDRFPNTKIGDWKRTSKLELNEITYRVFLNRKTNLEVSVIFEEGSETPTVKEGGLPLIPPRLIGIIPIIDEGNKNWFSDPRWFEDLTGNLVLYLSEEQDDDYDFSLGPEDEDRLSDVLSCYSWMKKTFRAWLKAHNLKLDIGTSENTHRLSGLHIQRLIPSMIEMLQDNLPEGVRLIIKNDT
jgi:hypothetical protein